MPPRDTSMATGMVERVSVVESMAGHNTMVEKQTEHD